jgi:hypothetical protein
MMRIENIEHIFFMKESLVDNEPGLDNDGFIEGKQMTNYCSCAITQFSK